MISEPAEHTRIHLMGVRTDYLKTLRGRSPTYDLIRARAVDLARATGLDPARNPEIMHCIEGTLLVQLRSDREEAAESERANVEAAKRGERASIRAAMEKILK